MTTIDQSEALTVLIGGVQHAVPTFSRGRHAVEAVCGIISDLDKCEWMSFEAPNGIHEDSGMVYDASLPVCQPCKSGVTV